MLSTLVYVALDGVASAFVVSFIFGFTYMTAMLIEVQLAARACPTAAAGTIFAPDLGDLEPWFLTGHLGGWSSLRARYCLVGA